MRDEEENEHVEMLATTPFISSQVSAHTKPLCPERLIVHSLQKKTYLSSLCMLAHKHRHSGH